MNRSAKVFQIPQSVKRDGRAYRQAVGRFLSGETRPVAFQAYRVPHGIYEQRTAGDFMVRVRIPAGMVFPQQMKRLAQLSRKYGNGVLHVTTRQDIQIHKVKIEQTPDVVEGLLEVGLSSRGGGGNTVRNITTCPRAGVCTNEVFDVRPYALALTEYLLDFESSFNLPRKFKVAFSGCPQDCALASVADLGFFAHAQDGNKGWRVYGAGGLGSNPQVAVKIEDFVEADEVFRVAETMKQVFDEYGDRTNKHRARLRYVLRRVGEGEFVKLYRKQLEKVQQEDLQTPSIPEMSSTSNATVSSGAGKDDKPANGYENWRAKNVWAQKNQGEFTVRLRLELGDIAAEDLAAIGALAETLGEGFARTTQSQDLLLCRVPEDDLPFVFGQLKELKTDVVGGAGPKLVVCAGASTCRLGLCKSRDLAEAINAEVSKTDWPLELINQEVRISGCPNCCGQHCISGIGFQGLAKRVGGKLVPCYVLVRGGLACEGQGRLAEQVGVVPAKNVPSLMSALLSLLAARKTDKEDLQSVIADSTDEIRKLADGYTHIPSADEQPDMYRDFGAAEDFSLAGRGPGECGAGVMDVIRLDIDQAKGALANAAAATDPKSKSDAIYQAIVAAARSLLITRGLEPRKEREIFAAFGKHLIEPGWLSPHVGRIVDQAVDYRMGESQDIADLEEAVAAMVSRVEELFVSLDAKLNFRAKQIVKAETAEKADESAPQVIDLRGVACPLNFVKAKLALEKIALGQVLEVLLDGGEPVRNVPASFVEQGQEVLDVSQRGEYFCVKVRKTG